MTCKKSYINDIRETAIFSKQDTVIIHYIKAGLPILTITEWIVITVWFTDYGFGIRTLCKRCHVLGQQFAQKGENMETDINKGFK